MSAAWRSLISASINLVNALSASVIAVSFRLLRLIAQGASGVLLFQANPLLDQPKLVKAALAPS